MNRLLVDAGATKTDFTLLLEGKIAFRYSSAGINPNYCAEAEMMQVFAEFVKNCPNTQDIETIHYYGAGCASQGNAALMVDLMSKFFPLSQIQVFSDLVAVCHALSMGQVSVISILGTGSASCLFDGEKIASRAPSLGYMLGDEGSGTNLGKRLLTLYLRGLLPDEMTAELEKTYDLTFEKVIHRVYKEPEPNQLMSQLALFVQKHIDYPLIRKLALDAFNDFFDSQKSCYPEGLPWHLSGSVAYYFREIIKMAAEQQNCKLGMIVATPMEKLIDYYKTLK
ncbi:MAG: hypothetical protein MJZ57_05975 [Bacteroidales bacterium]|nr:hypothetical protein [Bacteroidales bacterium]